MYGSGVEIASILFGFMAPDATIIIPMVDVTLNEATGSEVMMKLQTPEWELNIWGVAADFVRLHDIDTADWDARGSLTVGTSADAHVHWARQGDQAAILIGHDDETWDIAMSVPVAAVHEIASLAKRHMGEPPARD